MTEKPEKLRSVYVIKSTGGICKVGISNDPEERLRQLLTGHGLGLELVHVESVGDDAARLVERAAHRMLDNAKTGGEWFRVSADKAIQVVKIAAWIVNDCRTHIERPSPKRKYRKPNQRSNVIAFPQRKGLISKAEVEKAIAECGTQKGAAARLGISPRTLRRILYGKGLPKASQTHHSKAS
jgi:hypothetical protein